MVWSPCFNLSWIADEAAKGLPDLTFALSKMSSSNNLNSLISRPLPEILETLSKKMMWLSRKINERFDVSSLANNMTEYAHSHPILSILLAAAAVICSIPILAFILFVVATLSFTFIGFIFVEGTLLTFGTFFLSGILFLVGFLTLGFSVFVACLWFVVNKTFGVASAASQKLNFKQMQPIQGKPTIGNGLHHYD